MDMKRVSTGIKGLDRLISGYPKGRSVLITGKAGDGRTVLVLHFVNRCCANGEKTAYIGIDECKEDVF
jgi:KaiC/GvpD/RAD55 family RecA-like ATPase